MKKYNLFLDDIRDPIHAYHYTFNKDFKELDWKIVRNYEEFVEKITLHYEDSGMMPDKIAFDHDLADSHYAPREVWDSENDGSTEKYDAWVEGQDKTEKTGYDCAKWLVDYCMDNDIELPLFTVHSMNPVGGRNITDLLVNYMKFVEESNKTE